MPTRRVTRSAPCACRMASMPRPWLRRALAGQAGPGQRLAAVRIQPGTVPAASTASSAAADAVARPAAAPAAACRAAQPASRWKTGWNVLQSSIRRPSPQGCEAFVAARLPLVDPGYCRSSARLIWVRSCGMSSGISGAPAAIRVMGALPFAPAITMRVIIVELTPAGRSAWALHSRITTSPAPVASMRRSRSCAPANRK